MRTGAVEGGCVVFRRQLCPPEGRKPRSWKYTSIHDYYFFEIMVHKIIAFINKINDAVEAIGVLDDVFLFFE